MMLRKQFPLLFAVLLVLALPSAMGAQKFAKDAPKTPAAVMAPAVWHNTGEVSTLNLLYGAGGEEHAPNANATFKFVKEDMEGTSPKFTVKDEKGIEWKVKLGAEVQSETAATRLLWAAGYFVDEDYYLDSIKVSGLPKLSRGQKFVSGGGMVHRARLERKTKSIKNLGTWDWFHNQCGSTKEMNGLRVMMAFVNNWDLKVINNSVDEIDGEQYCVVSDIGATFGKTGAPFVRSKGIPKDYAASKFVAKVTPETVDLVMHSRPFFLSGINFPNYRTRTRMEMVTRNIPLADARGVGQRLALLSVEQIRDSFRAAGFTPEQVDVYTKTVQKRIAALNAL